MNNITLLHHYTVVLLDCVTNQASGKKNDWCIHYSANRITVLIVAAIFQNTRHPCPFERFLMVLCLRMYKQSRKMVSIWILVEDALKHTTPKQKYRVVRRQNTVILRSSASTANYSTSTVHHPGPNNEHLRCPHESVSH